MVLTSQSALEKIKQGEGKHWDVEAVVAELCIAVPELREIWNFIEGLILDPERFNGPRASVEATRLAALRVKIGLMKVAAKQNPGGSRVIKDGGFDLYDSLLELINTLKAMAKYDAEAAR